MVENTYRTILFEEFDSYSYKPNLCTILSNAENPAGETVYNEVKEKLYVHNFDEFLERFAPKVYEKHEPSTDGVIDVTYSTENSPGAIPLDIVNNGYYKMLLNLYRSKEKSGESNLKFNYEELFEQLKPRQEVENAKTLRKQLNAAYEKYYECQEKGESTDEARKIINRCRKKIMEQYEKSVINLLPLAMADLDTKIAAADKLLSKNAGKSEDEVLQIATGYTSFFREDGTLETAPVQIQAPTDTTMELPAKQIGGGERKLLSDVIKSDYDKKATIKNEFVRDLIVATYTPTVADVNAVEMSLAEVRQQQDINFLKKQSYEKTFQNAKAAFTQTMTETVQKLLGMQVLFDHATSKGELSEGLIVANCSVGSLMSDDCKEKFTRFIKRVGHESVRNRIWFSIVPGVSETSETLDGDDFGDFDDDFKSDSHVKPQATKTVSMNELKQFLSIMDDARIMTIFSFKADEENGFLMTPQYVESKRDSLKNIKYKHAVYAYPNFTLTRERTINLIEGAEQKLAIPGVYIDAAYVAGGLLMGSQQLDYLEKHGLKVHRQLPCVRIDFENTSVRQKLVTKFNRETDFDVNEELRDEINKDRFGFVFSGDEMGEIQNTYVYIANTLYKSPESDVYRPIYMTLVEDYVIAMYNKVQEKTRKGVKREFIDGPVSTWKRYAESKEHQNDVNLLLHEDESIDLNDNPETGRPELKIKLSALEAVLDNIEIAVEQKS